MFPNDYEVEIRDIVDVSTRWHPILFHVVGFLPTPHGVQPGYVLFYLDSDGRITGAPPNAKVRRARGSVEV